MKKILITGGCGFIGSNLTEYLLEKTDWKINILDNLSSGQFNEIENLNNFETRVNFFKGDITNVNDILKTIENCDYVVNLAAQTSVIESIKKPFKDENINIFGTLNILKLAVEYKIKKIIQASSAAAVGMQEVPINELKVPKPLSPYGASKLACEGYCSAFSNSFNLNIVVLRFSNVYGPKSYHKGSVIAKFIRQIIKGEELQIFGDGNQTRDFIYVKDICSGIYLSLIKKVSKFELIQLGTNIETSVNTLISVLKSISIDLNIKFPDIKYCDERDGEILQNYTDISKAKKKLNFTPKFLIGTSLKRTFEWFLEIMQ